MEETIPSAEQVVDALPEVLPLAADFPTATREQWEAQVVGTLNRHRPADRTLDTEQCLELLRTRTVDGLTLEPLYSHTDREGEVLDRPGVAPYRRGATTPTGAADAWDVRALHDDPDVATTHDAILTDLERGATSLWLQVGTGAIAVDDLPDVLAGVELDLAPVALSSESDQVGAAHALLSVCRDRGTALAPGSSLGLDLVARTAFGPRGDDGRGEGARGLDEAALAALAELAPQVLAEHPGVRLVTVDARLFHDAGASDVEELALALADGVEHLRALEAVGIPPAEGVRLLDFRVSASADQFLTIARLRALRQLWARVTELCDVPPEGRAAHQHAVTSWRMLTRDDPWVNQLRATTATFAAAAGGAQAITVLPYDHVHGYPDAFSRRVARNTQVVLAQESHIGRVADPAGGSWFVETLTDQLAGAAWEVFGRIEAAGGLTRALTESSLVTDLLAASRAERARRVADRSAAITGVSTFPMLDEPRLERRPRPLPGSAATGTAATGTGPVEPLLPRARDAAPFEALRDRAATAPALVFLATLGPRRDYGARETFTTSLLAAGGVHAVAHEVPASEPDVAADMARAFTASRARVAILCSSAARYAEHGSEVARALRAAGATQVLLAGSARELGVSPAAGAPADASPAALVDGTVHAGMDVLAFLDSLLDTLEVAR